MNYKLAVNSIVFCFAGFICNNFKTFSQDLPIINQLNTGKETSIRGISIPNPATVWLSGSNGSVGFSNDSGSTFKFIEIEKYKKPDFRDIQALNDSVAIIINAGFPGYILKTENSGKTWREVYQNNDKKIFFDGLDFWDKQHGIAFSDPIKNKLFIITTHDGGETWQEPDSMYIPECYEGEAGFAASGTSICCAKNGKVIIGTGGSHARVFISNDFGVNWKVIETPILSGKETCGIFSAFLNEQGRIYIAGGDYKADSLIEDSFFFTDDEGMSWNSAAESISGYRSCLLFSGNQSMVATGTNGTDFSMDNGNSWQRISDFGFNVAGTCKGCDYVIFGGKGGNMGKMMLGKP